MRKILFTLTAVLLLSNCGEKKKETGPKEETIAEEAPDSSQAKKVEPMAIKPDGSYFKATGTEPFWGLKIFNEKIELQTMEDTITTPSSEAIKAQDSNIKMFRVQTEATQMDIVIAQKECSNAMSGEVFPYTVTVSYKNTGGGETTVYEGCGSYITDYRLHDIWVLKELNGTAVSKEDFNGKDVPNMEININNNRFSGFSGCNRMTGSLFYEKDVLRFTQVASTRMACIKMEKESEFLKALQRSTRYKVENNSLYLSNSSQENLLVFKKID